MRFSVRDLVYIGIFGALWGASETGLGSVLHALEAPLAGAALAAVGVAIALVGRWFVPRPGSVLFIGLVTSLLKMLSVGGTVLNPMIAIVVESMLAEVVLTVGRHDRVTFAAAGAVATAWPLVHPFLTGAILAGRGFFAVYATMLRNGARVLGVEPSAAGLILGVLAVLHLVAGAAAGLLAWDTGCRVQSRLPRPAGRSTDR
jgi:hypothetical protein